jgi:hypothetical protein
MGRKRSAKARKPETTMTRELVVVQAALAVLPVLAEHAPADVALAIAVRAWDLAEAFVEEGLRRFSAPPS